MAADGRGLEVSNLPEQIREVVYCVVVPLLDGVAVVQRHSAPRSGSHHPVSRHWRSQAVPVARTALLDRGPFILLDSRRGWRVPTKVLLVVL